MRSLPRWLPILSLLLASSACSKGDPVQETCELLFSCDCATASYPDVAACVTAVNSELDSLRMKTEAGGLTFADDCLDRSLAVYTDSLECSSELTTVATTCSYCALIHGDKPVGAACTAQDGGSDCAKNLFCADGTCMDPCARLASGAACAEDNGGVVDSTGFCDTGLYCDYASTLTCKPVIAVGGACPDLAGCAAELFCGEDLTCQAVPREGEACEWFCQSHLVCDAGTCKVGPGEGEPCPENGECGLDTRCDFETNVCVVEDPLVCAFGDL